MPPTAYKTPEEARAGLIGTLPEGEETTLADWQAINQAAALVPGEPAVISSAAGERNFQTNVQPKIEAANTAVSEAARRKQEAEAARAAGTPPESLPPDVQAELEALKTPEERAYEARLADWDKQKEDARKASEELVLAETESAKAQIGVLTRQWEERRALLEQSNRGNVANWQQQFFRFGQAEYSPGMTANFISQKEQEGLRAVRALDDEYASKVSAVNSALSSKRFAEAAKLTKELGDIEEKALTLMHENAKEARKVNDTLREKQATASRQSAIAGLFEQGITEPAQILEYMNYLEDGTMVGDISLEEIEKTLKIINPDASLAGLDQDYRTYKYLQENDPEAVKGLTYFDYLNAVGNAKRKAEGGDLPLTPTVAWEDFLAQKEEELGMNVNPGSDLYKQLQSEHARLSTASTGKLTPTEKSDLQRAGLGSARPDVQTYFLGTGGFKDYYARELAAGRVEPVADLDALDALYTAWYNEQESSSSGKVSALIKALDTLE